MSTSSTGATTASSASPPQAPSSLAFGWGVADGEAKLESCGPEASPPTATCRPGLAGSGSGQFKTANGIAIDNDTLSPSHGDIYVEDAGNHRAQKFSPVGQFLLMFGGKVNANNTNVCAAGETCRAGTAGTGPGEFQALEQNAIATDSAGDVYLDDGNRVQKFSSAGALEGETPLPGTGYARGLAVDSVGDLYLLPGGAHTGVRKYAPVTGTELGSPRDEAGFPLSIALGSSDRLLVDDEVPATALEHHLFAYEPDGTQAASFDARPSELEGGLNGIAYGESAEAVYLLRGLVRIAPYPPPGPLPIEGSEGTEGIGPTTAHLAATLNAEGAPTEYSFQYGESEAYGEETTPQTLAAGFPDEALSVPVGSLQPSTTYHFRLIAHNANGAIEGPDKTFTTAPPVSIDATSASGVSSTAATLETELNPHGLPTAFRFEYDTSPYEEGEGPHGKSTPEASAGQGEGDVFRSAQIQGLSPSTTYHFRVLAENSLGVSEGPDRSFTTQPASPATALPDDRAWELVSPPDKHGSPLEAIANEGGLIQAATEGDAIAYFAKGPVDTEPAGNRGGTGTTQQLLSTRGTGGGWSTADIATAHRAPAGVVPGNPSEYKLFSSDLSLGALEPEGATPLSPFTSEKTPYLRRPNGEYAPLVVGCPAPPLPCPEAVAAHANVPAGTEFGGTVDPETPELFGEGVNFVTATPDLSHFVLTSPVSLVEGVPGGKLGLYEWSEGRLTLASLVPPGSQTSCGGPGGEECIAAAEAGAAAILGNHGFQVRNAISAGGQRLVFQALFHTESPLYMSDPARGEAVRLDATQPGAEGGASEPVYQTASSDGSRVFFTDGSRLTEGSTAAGAPDLYMCQIVEAAGHLACDLRDLSVDHNHGEAASVQGAVLGAAEDGSQVYFAAKGILAAGAVHGECGGKAEQRCNLYRYDVETRRNASGRRPLGCRRQGLVRGRRSKPRRNDLPRLPQWPLPRLHVAAPAHRLRQPRRRLGPARPGGVRVRRRGERWRRRADLRLLQPQRRPPPRRPRPRRLPRDAGRPPRQLGRRDARRLDPRLDQYRRRGRPGSAPIPLPLGRRPPLLQRRRRPLPGRHQRHRGRL